MMINKKSGNAALLSRYLPFIFIAFLISVSLACGIFTPTEPASTISTLPPTATPRPATPRPTDTPVPTHTATFTPVPPTPTPFAITEERFAADLKEDCNTEIEITKVEGSTISFTLKVLTIKSGGSAGIWCYGARHTWLGKLTFAGYTFDSDKDDPLQFVVDETAGYLYSGGKGTVTLPDGTQVTLSGQASGNGNAGGTLLFSDDFSNLAFEGRFDPGQWTPSDGLVYTQIEQEDGSMKFSKSTTDGSENGKIQTNSTWLPGEFHAVEARLKLSQAHEGEMGNISIGLTPLNNDDGWWAACGIQVAQTQPFFWCGQDTAGSPDFDYMNEGQSVEYDEWYTARIEINPTTAELTFTLDGRQVGKWQPARADKLLSSSFMVSIGAWTDDGTSITGYVDDVLVGK